MKAEPAVQRRLLDLAQVDGEHTRLAHRRRTLPEIDQHATAEAALAAGIAAAQPGRPPRATSTGTSGGSSATSRESGPARRATSR